MTPLIDIEKEINLRRVKPEYLISIFENYFKTIDKNYPVSFMDTLRYRKRFNDFLAKEKQLSNSIKKSADLAEKAANLMSKLAENDYDIDGNEEFSAELSAMTNGLEKETNTIENHQFDKKEFRQLILIREDLLLKNKLGSSALSSLIRSDLFDALTKIITFSIPFITSFFIGDFLEKNLSEFGQLLSKLLPALIFFFTIDKLIKWTEERFLWNRVIYLFEKYKAVKKIEVEKDYFFENFKEE